MGIMRTTRQFSITLPFELAGFIDDRIASGNYATESEVIREGLRALKDKDDVYKTWLNKVAAIQAKADAHPETVSPFAVYDAEMDALDRQEDAQEAMADKFRKAARR
jgi:antitoxin ParD1/3/4